MFSIKKTVILFLLAVISFSMKDGLKDIEVAHARYKATYLYNFAAREIEWPQQYKDGNFVIGIFGNSPVLLAELNSMVKNWPKNQKLEIRHFASPDAINKCHILYIAPDNTTSLPQVINKLKGQSTLIVTEKAGMANRGAGINFVFPGGGGIKIELNKNIVEKYNLKVSNYLQDHSIIVK